MLIEKDDKVDNIKKKKKKKKKNNNNNKNIDC